MQTTSFCPRIALLVVTTVAGVCRHWKSFAVLTLVLPLASAGAQELGTAFTYQGQLKQNGTPAPTGTYQMVFELYGDPDPLIGALTQVEQLEVSSGLLDSARIVFSQKF